MDVGLWVVCRFAGPIARFAGNGSGPEQRAEVIEEAGLPGEDVLDLGLRHLNRMAGWFLLSGTTFAVSIPVLVPIRVFADGRTVDLAFTVAEWLAFLPFFLSMTHLAKFVICVYLPERWWNPDNRLWRLSMLAHTPDILLALTLTTLTTPP
ncbi:hypothetical protein [Micromonospora endolithica]|uniref:hypothetical protein n=1 Tax=Micromonospora endolithica TaxID=230091 RepID=UPI0011ABBDA5|nr:hypothetical protein [Micromonospora endolithica]TWJ20319.1 hypothetical protein JD76_00417 [Micromonospora endolithica]